MGIWQRESGDAASWRAAADRDKAIWRRLADHLHLVHGLAPEEWQRLQQLSYRFLAEKHLDPVGGLQLTQEMALILAVEGVIPVLHLGMRYLDNWRSLILYPTTFIPADPQVDDMGVFHPAEPHTGQSWPNGPVILSWEEIEMELDGEVDYPQCVVIHELAHQMDVRTGDFDGMPPLRAGMDATVWIQEFEGAMRSLRKELQRGGDPDIDPYAAESPAEFWAVVCETFFVAPKILKQRFPGIYRLLQQLFHQDPMQRLA